MSKEQIEELKNKYPDGIYDGKISFNDAEGKLRTVEFIFRKPTIADVESHTKAAQKNPIIASINLVQSLIVHPEPAPIMAVIQEFPAAAGKFVDEQVSPFFGNNVITVAKKL